MGKIKKQPGVNRRLQGLRIAAIYDYYNSKVMPNTREMLKCLAGQKHNLTEEEKSDCWAIRTNLEDEVYWNGLKY